MLVSGGEALVDLVPTGSIRDPFVPRMGGGPYNVALAAARLGAPTAFLSRVSTDHFGSALVERLRESGVDTALLQQGPEPTTLTVITLDSGSNARYSFYVEGTADRLVTDPGALPEATRALSLGTLGMMLDPGAAAYETVLRRESRRGVLTALDPNIRPQMISDPDGYRARFRSWLPDVRLLKMSVQDARWLAAGTEIGTAVREWVAAGPQAVVLTSGQRGLSVITPAGELSHVAAVHTSVMDTVGAGDTVQGALLAWLLRHRVTDLVSLGPDEWHTALSFAAQAAAVTVSRQGAEPPWAAELFPLL